VVIAERAATTLLPGGPLGRAALAFLVIGASAACDGRLVLLPEPAADSPDDRPAAGLAAPFDPVPSGSIDPPLRVTPPGDPDDGEGGPDGPACSRVLPPLDDLLDGDPRFADGFGLPGVSGPQATVRDVTSDLGAERLFIAGTFDHVGAVPASNVAVLHPGNGIDPLGGGLSAPARSLAPDPLSEGEVWAATLDVAGPDSSLLHRWDGERWHPPVLVDGRVSRLRATREGLVVVGDFSAIGRSFVAHAAVLGDDGRFGPLDPALPDGPVHDVVDTGTGLCLAGAFRRIGAMPSPGTACLTQAGWDPRAGLPDDDGEALVLAANPDGDLLVGGDFRLIQGGAPGAGAGLARFDGSTWHPVGDGLTGFDPADDGIVRALVALPAGELILAGDFDGVAGRSDRSLAGLARYRPETGFAPLWPGPADRVEVEPGRVRGLSPGLGAPAADPGDPTGPASQRILATAYGAFRHTDSPARTALATWSGDRWALPPAADDGQRGVFGVVQDLVAPGSCPPVLVGSFLRAGDVATAHAATVDAEGAWATLDGPGPPLRRAAQGRDGSLVVSVLPRGAEDAVFRRAGPGADWRPLGGGVRGTAWALAVGDDGTTWVGGRLVTAGGLPAPNLVGWHPDDGWTLPDGGPDGAVFDLTFDADGRLLVAGDFQEVGGEPTGALVRYDPTTGAWASVGPPAAPPIRAVALQGDAIVIGRGDPAAETEDAVPGPLLEALRRGSYRVLAGDRLPAEGGAGIHDLASDGTHLFVGGSFPGGLFILEGRASSVPAAGVDGVVHAILPTPDGILLGGAFSLAGETPSHGIALLAASD